MFEVGDKVRYVPNEDSPRNPCTDYSYIDLEDSTGRITSVYPRTSYPYRVHGLLFSEAELVKVA